MWKQGKRSFVVGSILLLLIMVAHTLGVSGANHPESSSQIALLAAMRGEQLGQTPLGPFSAWDVMVNLSLFMSLACGAWGAQNLCLAWKLDPGQAAFRISAWGSFGLSLLAALLGLATHLFPPALTFSLAAAAFAFALKRP
jgi:hypothetical protein